jgi:hypothetical protein
MHTIDFRSMSYDPPYLAKLIWEKLFRLTNAERFDKLYDFLCDLKIFETKLEDQEPYFFWGFETDGFTDCWSVPTNRTHQYRISINWDEKIITLTEER